MRPIEIITVELGSGVVCRPVIVWCGTRTVLADRLVASFERFPGRPKAIDEAGTRWRSEHDVPVGAVFTTTRGREPYDGSLFLVTAAGLEPISYVDAWDRLDPAGSEERAAQRAHDAAADAEGLPRELARFVGSHSLRNGVHRAGDSFVYAERCTGKQAFWRRATREEVAALAG
jgi:hypothetical protein